MQIFYYNTVDASASQALCSDCKQVSKNFSHEMLTCFKQDDKPSLQIYLCYWNSMFI